MKQNVNSYQFADAFKTAGRADQFSYKGLDALFDFLEEVEPDSELDVIALCCDFTEYESALECVKETVSDWEYECSYSIRTNTEEENEEGALEYLREQTCVIEVGNGSIIIHAF